jgi:O-antigen/teichoic acid export membrane protein
MQPDDPEPSLRQRVFSGMAWSFLQTAGSRLLGMVIILVLARVLGPADFGIVTLAFVVLGAMTSVVDLGVSDVLVRRMPQDQADYDSAFWVVMGFALLLAAATVAAASTLARLLNQPLLPPLLWILAATLPLAAIELIQGARMRAEMKFKPLALRTLAATAVGGTVAIGMAFAGAGYWALLAKGLVESLVSVTLMWASCSYRPGRQFSWARWCELFASARHLLGTRLIDIVNQRYDAFVVGARLGPAALGLYSASFRLYTALMETLFATVNRVTLPAFAKMRGDAERARSSLLRLVSVTSFFTLPTFAALGVMAEPLVVTLLGPPWRDAAPILSALCFGGLLFSVSHYNAPMLNATGRTELLLRLMLTNAALIVAAVTLGANWGAAAVALGLALRGYLLLPMSLAYLRRAIGLRARDWLATVAPPLAATAVTAAALAALQWLLLPPTLAAPWRLLVLGASFPLIHAVVAATLIPSRSIVVFDELSTLRPGFARVATLLRRWQHAVWRR